MVQYGPFVMNTRAEIEQAHGRLPQQPPYGRLIRRRTPTFVRIAERIRTGGAQWTGSPGKSTDSLIDKDDAAEMRAWAHDGGFSVDGSVRIEGADRTGLERLLRYCARPPFALEHLHQRDAEHLVYRNPKPVRGTAPRTRPAALVLTPLELITKIARAGAATKGPSSSLLRRARAQCIATRCGDGARPCRRSASADFCGNPRRAPPSCRVALSLGHAAGAHL
jgi:hypothetical protein